MSPFHLMGHDLALDLGGASTQIYVRGKGIVLDEPSVVVRNPGTGQAAGFGSDAAGRDGDAVWPVGGSGPLDTELTRRMVRHFLRKVHGHPFSRPRMVMALPDDWTPFDRIRLRDLAFEAEARRICLVQHGLAAALGTGLPVADPAGMMIIDVGRGATRVAVLSGARVVSARTAETGGDAMNRAIVRLVEREQGLFIGELAAEEAKLRVGSAWKPFDRQVEVHGRDLVSGLDCSVTLTAQQVWEATRQPVDAIARAAVAAVESCPAELAADVGDHGAVLLGGGALLRGLSRRLRSRLGIPVHVAERPIESLALGLGRCVDDPGLAGNLAGNQAGSSFSLR
jgi:rod shape-determining protein MreB